MLTQGLVPSSRVDVPTHVMGEGNLDTNGLRNDG
jgi:hypothetical protein